jgi:hypothetical protein
MLKSDERMSSNQLNTVTEICTKLTNFMEQSPLVGGSRSASQGICFYRIQILSQKNPAHIITSHILFQIRFNIILPGYPKSSFFRVFLLKCRMHFSFIPCVLNVLPFPSHSSRFFTLIFCEEYRL